MYTTYQNAIKNIEEQLEEEINLAKRALLFIFSARRPLTVRELLHALAVPIQNIKLHDTAIPENEILLKISAGLIKVDEKLTSFVQCIIPYRSIRRRTMENSCQTLKSRLQVHVLHIYSSMSLIVGPAVMEVH